MDFKLNQSIPVVAGRIILYGIVLVGVAYLISLEGLSSEGGEKLYGEGSLTEYMQILFLVLSSFLLGILGFRYKANRSLSILLVGISLVACIREFDNILDHYVFDGAWQVLALLAAALTGYWVYKLRAGLKQAIAEFMNQPAFGIIISGFLIVFTFSRIFGRKVFWKAVMAEHYIRSVKNVAEEGIELLGYTLIFLGIFEYFIYCVKKDEDFKN